MKARIMAVVMSVACVAGLAHANLLLNGEFEVEGAVSGTASNWAGAYGYADWAKMEGNKGVFFGNNNAMVTMYQQVGVVGSEVYAGGLFFNSLDGYTNAATAVSIDWFDATYGALGGSVSTSFVCSASLDWTYFSVTGAAPASAAYATFTVTALNAGNVGALAMDNSDFLAIPEPASALLFGLSGLGLIAWKRFRK